MKFKKCTAGFSVVELLCSLIIISALVALFLPSIQSVRETARSTSCQNKLRALGLASLNYESAHGSLPPGNLGFSDVIIARQDFSERWRDDKSFEFYWKDAQHTSSLAILLPFLDQEGSYNLLPRIAFSDRLYGDFANAPHDWLGAWGDVSTAMRTPQKQLFCPSDDAYLGISDATPVVGAQPVFFIDQRGSFDGILAKFITNDDYFSTNYVGCVGAHSGGMVPKPEYNRYLGLMGCRTKTRMAQIEDGSTQTILIGESIGLINNGRRDAAYIWTFGSLGRGRGNLRWGATFEPKAPERTLLGDWEASSIAGFGSKHPATVNTVFAGGNVSGVERQISLDVWYGMCGMRDGVPQPR